MPSTRLKVRPFAVPSAPPARCPIRASLGPLGRKWALLVLRDVAFHEDVRFTDILRENEGLTPRVLSMRLRELAKEGVIERVERDGVAYYALTHRGRDVLPILAALLNYGMKHGDVFADGKPRSFGEVMPKGAEMMRGMRG